MTRSWNHCPSSSAWSSKNLYRCIGASTVIWSFASCAVFNRDSNGGSVNCNVFGCNVLCATWGFLNFVVLIVRQTLVASSTAVANHRRSWVSTAGQIFSQSLNPLILRLATDSFAVPLQTRPEGLWFESNQPSIRLCRRCWIREQ